MALASGRVELAIREGSPCGFNLALGFRAAMLSAILIRARSFRSAICFSHTHITAVPAIASSKRKKRASTLRPPRVSTTEERFVPTARSTFFTSGSSWSKPLAMLSNPMPSTG